MCAESQGSRSRGALVILHGFHGEGLGCGRAGRGWGKMVMPETR